LFAAKVAKASGKLVVETTLQNAKKERPMGQRNAKSLETQLGLTLKDSCLELGKFSGRALICTWRLLQVDCGLKKMEIFNNCQWQTRVSVSEVHNGHNKHSMGRDAD